MLNQNHHQAWMGEVDCILSVASDENKTHL